MKTALTITWLAKGMAHVLALFLGFMLAYEARLDPPLIWWFDLSSSLRVLGWGVIFAVIGGGVEAVFQTERGAWRFASARDVVGLARNVTLTTALFLLVVFVLDRGEQLPRSVLPLAWVLSIVFLVAARMAWRLPREGGLLDQLLPAWWRGVEDRRPPLVLVGDMAEVDRQLRHLMADPDLRHRPVGAITPNPGEIGLRLHGVPFWGLVDDWRAGRWNLPPHAASAALLFLRDPIRGLDFPARRLGELRAAGHTLLRPVPLAEVGGASRQLGEITEIPIEELLPRPPITLAPGPVADLIRGKRVLVTGAGGSIGSEIARQMVRFGCAHLTLLDHSEFLLFEVDRELGGVDTLMTRRAVIANVRDETRIREIFDEERPDIVFHAAALKHVVLVENNPAEGVLTNVLGTWNVLRAAVDAKVAQFVLISTDKAVDPSNVMGATKRIAETLLELAPVSETRLSAVRFGNVLGSAGSVVPIFRDQIARGGPVTVTHPDVNRYFMTIPEAVQLVLHSTAVKATSADEGPSKFLLEMGEPVRIADLARQMIELSGKKPEVDIRIEFTGLKKGEKIAEVLSDDREDPRPCVAGILQVVCQSAGRLSTARVQEIISAALAGRSSEASMLVSEAIREIRQVELSPYQNLNGIESGDPS